MTRRKRPGGGMDEKEEARMRQGREGRDWKETWDEKERPERGNDEKEETWRRHGRERRSQNEARMRTKKLGGCMEEKEKARTRG